LKTVILDTLAAAAMSATVTASKPRLMNNLVAISAIPRFVSSFFLSRKPLSVDMRILYPI